MRPIIATHNLKKRFSKEKIISYQDFDIEEGEFIGIVGKSGSGKSTLLNILGLIDESFEGEIVIHQKTNPKKRQAMFLLRNELAYLFQNYALIANKSVKENLIIALAYKKIKDKKQAIRNALVAVGLEGLEDRLILSLSGGEQQRVALARVILKDASIILADEPTGNLDETNAKIVLEIMQQMHKKGKTILMVTHDIRLLKYCDKVIDLERNVI